MAFDIKSISTPILFPWFMLSLRMLEVWNKRVGSSVYCVDFSGLIVLTMDGHVGGVLLESRGYRFSLTLGFKWIEECIVDGRNIRCFLYMFRKRTWSFVRARFLEFTGMSLVPLVVCGCEDFSPTSIFYGAVMIYDKRCTKCNKWSGLCGSCGICCGWDWGSLECSCDICYGCSSLECYDWEWGWLYCGIYSSYSCGIIFVHVVIKDIPSFVELVFRLWGMVFGHDNTMWSYDCLVESIMFIIVMVWGACGMGNQIVLTDSLYVWMVLLDVRNCMFFVLYTSGPIHFALIFDVFVAIIFMFPYGDRGDVFCGKTTIRTTCVFQYHGKDRQDNRWGLVIRDGLLWWIRGFPKTKIFRTGFKVIIWLGVKYHTDLVKEVYITKKKVLI